MSARRGPRALAACTEPGAEPLPQLSIIFPAYNEAARLPATLAGLKRALAQLELKVGEQLGMAGMSDALGGGWAVRAAALAQGAEVIVVDDGSSDGTAEGVLQLAPSLPGLRLIRCAQNRGKGHALRVGMLAAKGRLRVMADADGATDWATLPALLAPLLLGEAELVIGSRYLEGAEVEVKQPRFRRFFSRGVNHLVQATLLPGIVDTHCGFKAFTAKAACAVFGASKINGWSCDLEILALARREGFRIAEQPVRWRDDAASRVRPVRDLIRSSAELALILRRLWRPRLLERLR